MFVSIFTDANAEGRLVAGTAQRVSISGLLASKLNLASPGLYCGFSLLALRVEACYLHVQYKRVASLHIKRERVHHLCKAGVDSGSSSRVAHRSSLPVIDLGCIYAHNQNASLIYRVNVFVSL